jgi:hypothetical protein
MHHAETPLAFRGGGIRIIGVGIRITVKGELGWVCADVWGFCLAILGVFNLLGSRTYLITAEPQHGDSRLQWPTPHHQTRAGTDTPPKAWIIHLSSIYFGHA